MAETIPAPVITPVSKPPIEGAKITTETGTETPPPPEEPWRKVKHKYKANGELVEVEYDELVKRAEKADGAEKRLYEATRKEREILARLDRLKEGSFEDAVELLGGDKRARELAEKYVWDKLQYDELPPEKKEALEEKKRADKLAKELEDIKKLEDSKSKAEQDKRAAAIVNKEINDAIAEAEKAGLPVRDVPEYVERIIEEMILHLEYLEECEAEGIPPSKSPLSPRDVLRKLQDRDSKKSQNWVKRLTAKELRDVLSKDQLDELRAAEIDGLYAPTPKRQKAEKPAVEGPVDPFKEKPQPASNRRSTKDWFGAMEKRYER